MNRRTTIALLGAVAALSMSFRSPQALDSQGACTARAWERYEARLDGVPEVANPFDPDQVDVTAEFVDPRGRLHEVPGFAYRAFDRSLVGGRERLESTGPIEWRARFAPGRSGLWRWRWRYATPERSATSPWRWLAVATPAAGRHGPLEVSPDDPRYLRHADGTPYFAVGENVCWYDGRGTFAYDDWLAKLGDAGANYIRLWMPSWAFGLEWIERDAGGEVVASSLGDYTARLDRAWQLDRVFEEADGRGIQVMLSIQNHGPFSLTQNSEWTNNPYNAANGGPLVHPADLFTDDEARRLFRRRLRYIAARWGAEPNLLAWELWNEVDLAEQPPPGAVVDWHVEMAGTLGRHDPADHLVTTSVGGVIAILDFLLGQSLAAPLWERPEIDFVQMHLYSLPGLLPIDFGGQTAALFSPLRPFGKPMLLAEAGVDFRGPAETLAADPTSEGIHDIVWSGIFAGTFGTGMSWWWDNVVDPEDLYPHFLAVAAFVEGVAFDREGFATGGATASAPGRELRAQALRGERTALAWIENARHRWFPPESGLDPSEIEGASVALEGLADGLWEARWFDPYDGGERLSEIVDVVEGALTLAAPAFSRDIALRLDRAP